MILLHRQIGLHTEQSVEEDSKRGQRSFLLKKVKICTKWQCYYKKHSVAREKDAFCPKLQKKQICLGKRNCQREAGKFKTFQKGQLQRPWPFFVTKYIVAAWHLTSTPQLQLQHQDLKKTVSFYKEGNLCSRGAGQKYIYR